MSISTNSTYILQTILRERIAEDLKKDGKTFGEMIEKKIQDLKYNRPFNQLTEKEQTKVIEEIIKSSGKPSKEVNAKMLLFKHFGRGIVVCGIAYLVYDLYISENKTKAIISNGAAIGGGILGGSLSAWSGHLLVVLMLLCVCQHLDFLGQ